MILASPPDTRSSDECLVFRGATAADVVQLASWNQQLIEDERHDNAMSLDQLEARMRTWLATEYRAVIFEESAKRAPAAYALFRCAPEWIHLRQFFVVRDRRRRGIGARAIALLREAVLPPDKAVIVEAMTSNPAALSFWRAVGFDDRYVGLESLPTADAERSVHRAAP